MGMPKKDSVLGDYYYRAARREGYRSRSALKLKEIAQKYHILRRGSSVADLGAAPGGWLQVEREFVGSDGLVIGIDISPIRPLPFENVKLIQGDIASPETREKIYSIAGRKLDVIVSDLAPKFTGVHDVDHSRQIGLALMALESAKMLLKRNGSMIIKVLMGSEFKSFQNETVRLFRNVRICKPAASRDTSSEVYLVCTGFKGEPSPPSPSEAA